ncbi:DNA methyltransferase [Spirulina sp. CCNP1310]|uniref:class I SAM-dependent DNA methyltransferase n=1 Tax=Spirulina sp. CCNP1310 TaxID=3110249 RepID=UPI002B1F9F89|nr:DNA methyltransferase [Spirulina sp. CCNP1310]MEA5421231.1 DNA methyltransferase [Spirulina sp. CCNP1310]
MNAVEIEEAVSRLAEAPFDGGEFPYAFLEAFGNKTTTIKRLKSGSSNQSDLGGVLQRNNIHIKVCGVGEVGATLAALRDSGATARQKVKFILATDGVDFEAENVLDGETVACAYPSFADHFGFFLPLAGITTVRQIRENAFDIKATGRLNRLYLELVKGNPDWDTEARREDFNHFMARLIFCFFAEDTNIFHGEGLFTETIAQMTAGDGSNTGEVMSELFRAMATPVGERVGLRGWANQFPYVNGGLFAGGVDVPRFSKVARSYLLHVGGLDWRRINPDIFGSMIQAVADEQDRAALGMHYTSVPNILKVLNPLFLDDLRGQLAAAGENGRKLLNLRQRLGKIRVFDPACGSGNFLVIAYKEMRGIEAEVNRRRGEGDRRSEIALTNFRGIELRHFAAEIARLALIIAEYQCDVLYRGEMLALAEFLPLKSENWVTCGNALRLNWLELCPPTGRGVEIRRDDLDLWQEMKDEAEIEFENEGGETYICGNPPFSGFNAQTPEQKIDLKETLRFTKDHKYFDYVSGWFYKSAECLGYFNACAFVSTNSIVQGVQVPILWKPIFDLGVEIYFAHQTFVWKNNAANNAGVFCVIIGLTKTKKSKNIFGEGFQKEVSNINAYLTDSSNVFVNRSQTPISLLPPMSTGNIAYDGGNLIISEQEREDYIKKNPALRDVIRPLTGSKEFIRGERRSCIWITSEDRLTAEIESAFADRFNAVRMSRQNGGKIAKNYAHIPYRFYMTNESNGYQILVPRVSSVRREYLPIAYLTQDYIISDSAQAIFDAPLWLFSLIGSKIHLAWVHAVSGKLKGDFRYSAIICYNTFPVPTLTTQNKKDLTRCAEDILLAREQYFPATIAEMYDPKHMDSHYPLVREAHNRNDETLERIYIGRRFKNDTERLEKLFQLYTQLTPQKPPTPPKTKKTKPNNST